MSKWERGYQINQIRIQNDLIITSDALRSIDVLRWTGGKLKLVGRDHSSLWPLTISMLGQDEVLVAEASQIKIIYDIFFADTAAQGQGHIYSYKLKDSVIERAGAYYLGEQITEIREG